MRQSLRGQEQSVLRQPVCRRKSVQSVCGSQPVRRGESLRRRQSLRRESLQSLQGQLIGQNQA